MRVAIVVEDVILRTTTLKLIMASTKLKSAFLVVRITPKARTKFHKKAERYGKPSDVLREIVEAFNDDRITIHPPVNPKENLYA